MGGDNLLDAPLGEFLDTLSGPGAGSRCGLGRGDRRRDGGGDRDHGRARVEGVLAGSRRRHRPGRGVPSTGGAARAGGCRGLSRGAERASSAARRWRSGIATSSSGRRSSARPRSRSRSPKRAPTSPVSRRCSSRTAIPRCEPTRLPRPCSQRAAPAPRRSSSRSIWARPTTTRAYVMSGRSSRLQPKRPSAP